MRKCHGAARRRWVPDVHPGREAGFRHGRLTMEELLKENRRVEVDLSGLKD